MFRVVEEEEVTFNRFGAVYSPCNPKGLPLVPLSTGQLS